MFTKSYRPSTAHCALTVAPSCSISLFTSRIRPGFCLMVWTPSGVRVLSSTNVGKRVLSVGRRVSLRFPARAQGKRRPETVSVMGLPCGTSKPLLAAIAATLAFSGASARGAVLKTDRACYRAGESVTVTGGPFTPSGAVGLSLDGAPLAGPFTAGPTGSLTAQLRAPAPGRDEQRPFRVAASDRQRPALSGSVSPLVSRFGVTVRPSGGRPGARRRIAARGFTGGGTLYAHVVRHRRKATVRLGRLEGACGT